MELISVVPILPDQAAFGQNLLIQIVPIDLQAWAAPKTYRIATELSFQKRNHKKFQQLSDRNKEVLALIGRCKKAEEIGKELFIGVNTVNSHKKRIKELLETNDTWELIHYELAFDLVRTCFWYPYNQPLRPRKFPTSLLLICLQACRYSLF